MENEHNFDNMCSHPECAKPASFMCPTCVKLQLEPSYFCSQDCFKDLWNMHKMAHKKRDEKIESGFKFTGPLRPHPYSFTGRREVPTDIVKPDYAKNNQGAPNASFQQLMDKSVPVCDEKEIGLIREACRIGREALDAGHRIVAPGVTTEAIDKVVHDYIISQGAYPSPLGYYNFPRSCCTSINECICHGIPDTRPLQEGDILNLDISCYKNGVHADLNETFLVGKAPESSRALVEATYDCLQECIKECKPGSMYRNMGNIISGHVEPKGYSVVRSYQGHGVGRMFHQAPQVPHYKQNKAVGFMKPGHIFTIEPMINMGVWKDITWNDKWTSTTTDGQRSAQFEHTILITEDGCEVLTARLKTSPPLEHILQKPAEEEKKE